jgi:gliding motility-associated-like protein
VVRSLLILCLLSVLSATTKGQQVVSLCEDSNRTFTYYAFCNSIGQWTYYINGEYVSNQYQFTITWDVVGSYHIVGIFDNGCGQASNEYIVNVLECLQYAIYFPNTFTPDGDGLNDYWSPIGIGIENIRWYIFDRWGLQIYAAYGKDDKWDGCMWHDGKRRPCQSDVYVWLAEWNYIKGGWHSQNGRVTIAR